MRKKFEDKYAKVEKYRTVRDDCHCTSENKGTAHIPYKSKNGIPKLILVVVHNGSNYDYHYIIKELTE